MDVEQGHAQLMHEGQEEVILGQWLRLLGKEDQPKSRLHQLRKLADEFAEEFAYFQLLGFVG